MLQQKDDTTSKSDSTGLPAFIPESEKNSPDQQIARRGERPILAGAIILIFDAFLFEFFLDLVPILIPSLILVLGAVLFVAGVIYRNVKMVGFSSSDYQDIATQRA
jgi:hypothetical protein